MGITQELHRNHEGGRKNTNLQKITKIEHLKENKSSHFYDADSETGQVIDHVTDQVTDHVTDHVKKLILTIRGGTKQVMIL